MRMENESTDKRKIKRLLMGRIDLNLKIVPLSIEAAQLLVLLSRVGLIGLRYWRDQVTCVAS